MTCSSTSDPKLNVEAFVYDCAVSATGRHEWETGIGSLLVAKDVQTGHVLDIGCGTGLGAEVLHRIGRFRIDGLDISQAMLAAARLRRLYRALYLGDMLTYKFPTEYDIVCCGFDTFNYTKPLRRLSFFSNIRRKLKKRGILVFDTLERRIGSAATIRVEAKICDLPSGEPVYMKQNFRREGCETIFYIQQKFSKIDIVQKHRQHYSPDQSVEACLKHLGFYVTDYMQFSLEPDAPLLKSVYLCQLK